jgi:hypothetical protein
MTKFSAQLILSFDEFSAANNIAAERIMEEYIDKLAALCEDIDSDLIWHSADSHFTHASK